MPVPEHKYMRSSQVRRKLLKCSAILAFTYVLTACGGGNVDSTATRAAAWTASQSDLTEDVSALGIPKPTPAEFTNQTIRQVARLSLDGNLVRIKFSNRFGKVPLTLNKVHVARSVGAAEIDTSSDHAVTFAGAPSVTIEAGQDRWSDAVALPVEPQIRLAVSIYMEKATIATGHRFSTSSTYVSTGDQTTARDIFSAAENVRSSSYFMSEIAVERSDASKVVVAFGDSISDGVASSTNAFLDYPSQLSNRALKIDRNISVVNAGMGGNRWLNTPFGLPGVRRFTEQVLGVTGVTHTIILLGTNDLGLSQLYQDQVVTAEQVIAAMTEVISLAKAKNVKVYLGTLIPFKGGFFYTIEGEAKRQTINAWVRANQEVAGVIDFDKAIQDPEDPLRIPTHLHSGDSLHPNDAGYAKLATAVDLAMFK